jgi:hypothetical protein
MVSDLRKNMDSDFRRDLLKHAKYPHCDMYVLHKPGQCEYCDLYPQRHVDRITAGINFTGEKVPGFAPCPAEVRRELSTINMWYGNIPKKEE